MDSHSFPYLGSVGIEVVVQSCKHSTSCYHIMNEVSFGRYFRYNE